MLTVQDWQRFYNMEPRSDSQLTALYERGLLPGVSARKVARELVATHFIYQNTLYKELIEEYMRHVANRLRATYALSWTSTWQIVRFYAPVALKLHMVIQTATRIPEFLCPQSSSVSESGRESLSTIPGDAAGDAADDAADDGEGEPRSTST